MKVVPPIHRFHVRSFDFEAWWNPQIGSTGSTGIADKRRCGSGPHRHVSLCWPAKGNLQKIKPLNTWWLPIWRSEGLGVWEAREKDPAGMTWLWHALSVLLWRWANTSSCPAALRSKMQFKMQLPSKNLLRQKRLAVSVYIWDFASHFRFISHRKNKGPRPSHEEEQLEAFNIVDWIARSANPIIPYSSRVHCSSLKSKRTWFIKTAKKPLRWPGFIQGSKPAALTRKHIFLTWH